MDAALRQLRALVVTALGMGAMEQVAARDAELETVIDAIAEAAVGLDIVADAGRRLDLPYPP
jgi:hypothetical protein